MLLKGISDSERSEIIRSSPSRERSCGNGRRSSLPPIHKITIVGTLRLELQKGKTVHNIDCDGLVLKFATILRLGENGQSITEYAIPYWSIVIPLTLVSAWLLLGKLRHVKKPEPTPAEAP